MSKRSYCRNGKKTGNGVHARTDFAGVATKLPPVNMSGMPTKPAWCEGGDITFSSDLPKRFLGDKMLASTPASVPPDGFPIRQDVAYVDGDIGVVSR